MLSICHGSPTSSGNGRAICYVPRLPYETGRTRALKNTVAQQCTGCHIARTSRCSKFDAAGWARIIYLMKHVNVSGVYLARRGSMVFLDFQSEKDVGADLGARARPVETSMKYDAAAAPDRRSRARRATREYDVPSNRRELPPVPVNTARLVRWERLAIGSLVR